MKKIIAMTVLSFVFILGCRSFSVQAATMKNGVALFDNGAKDSFSADITGDGKADTIEYESNYDDKTYKSTVSLKVNGAEVKTWSKVDYPPNVKIVKVAKEYFIEITTEGNGVTSGKLFKYKNGQLKTSLNYENLINKSLLTKGKFAYTDDAWDMITATKVKGSKIYMEINLGTKSLGQIKITNLPIYRTKNSFTVKKNTGNTKFTLIDKKKGKPVKSFTAKKKITVYKTLGGTKKAKFSIKKNSTFKITKGAIVNKNIYIKVKTSKGTGWIKLTKSALVKAKGMLVWG